MARDDDPMSGAACPKCRYTLRLRSPRDMRLLRCLAMSPSTWHPAPGVRHPEFPGACCLRIALRGATLSHPLSREFPPLGTNTCSYLSRRAFCFRLLVLVALVVPSARELQCQAPPPKIVLVLNSYRTGYAWTDDQVRGIRSVLSAQSYPVELYVEYMDAARRPDEKQQEALRTFYQTRYGDQAIDLIVSTDDAALQFLLKYKGSLFGKRPLVFCGVNNAELAEQVSRDTTTGVIEVFASEELLGLALRLPSRDSFRPCSHGQFSSCCQFT